MDAQEAENDSVLHSDRAAIAFRKTSAALSAGSTSFIDLPEPLLAFHRRAEDETLTCVFNLSGEVHNLTLSAAAVLKGPANAALNSTELELGQMDLPIWTRAIQRA